MITALAEEVGAQIETYADLAKTVAHADTIRATAENLLELCRDFKEWANTYEGIEPLISTEHQTQMRSSATEILARVRESKERFQEEPNQRDALSWLVRQLKDVNANTARSWMIYAQAEIAPLKQQADFARTLPRMQGAITEIDALILSLDTAARKLPRRRDEIKSFQQDVKALDQKLGKIKGLRQEQKDLLDKVRKGTATLKDLDEKLLEWCKEENLAGRIKLTF